MSDNTRLCTPADLHDAVSAGDDLNLGHPVELLSFYPRLGGHRAVQLCVLVVLRCWKIATVIHSGWTTAGSSLDDRVIERAIRCGSLDGTASWTSATSRPRAASWR